MKTNTIISVKESHLDKLGEIKTSLEKLGFVTFNVLEKFGIVMGYIDSSEWPKISKIDGVLAVSPNNEAKAI